MENSPATFEDMLDQGLNHLNSLSSADAEVELLKCCGSRRWARRVADNRPFTDVEDLCQSAETIWWALDEDDWLEAFRSHPKIGERKAAATVKEESQKWSAQEQAGVGRATEETKLSLAEMNKKYEERFGFIFIVCATGKTPEEMLANLNQRLSNPREEELRIAAAEQAKITQLRIRKLLNQ